MSQSVMLVIDFINDIVHPDGKFSSAAAYVKEHQVIEHANQAITAARDQKIPILFVKLGFSANYLEWPPLSPLYSRVKALKALQLNTWGTEFHQALDKTADDDVIVKHRVGAFHATGMEAYLRAIQTKEIFICGVSTDLTVQTTARDAHDRDYKVTIIKDACGAMTEEIHEQTIKSLARVAKIISTTQLFPE